MCSERPGPPASTAGDPATQRRDVLALWLLYALFSAGLQLTDGVAQTLFLKRVGVAHLPLMFMVKALLDVLAAMLYLPVARRLGGHRTMAAMLLFAAAGTAGARGLLPAESAVPYLALFAFDELLQTALKIHWGVFLLEHFTADAGQRAFPVIYTGARVGAMLGGLLLAPLAGRLGLPALLLVAAALFVLPALLVRRPRAATDPLSGGGFGPPSAIDRGLAMGPRSALLRATALATAAMVLCRFALRFEYSAIAARLLGELELARFYGLYTVAANAVAALLQVLLTGRLFARAGLTGANLLYAVSVAGAALAVSFAPGAVGAVVARLVETELKVAVKTPLSNLLYGAFAAEQRAAARALVFGLVVPAATLGAAALLGAPRIVVWWLLPAAAVFVVATLMQNRAYSRR